MVPSPSGAGGGHAEFVASGGPMVGPKRHLTEKTSKTRWPSPRPFHGRRTFYGRTGWGLRPPRPPPSFPPSAIRTANFSPEFFREGGQGGRSRSFHFKKFAKANFLKWCRGEVWGGEAPLRPPHGTISKICPSGANLLK